MSVIAYGYIVKNRRLMTDAQVQALDASGKTENKLITGIAALVPAEILGLHALAISWWTSTDDSGKTTITEAVLLGGSFFVLLVLTVAGFLIGRGKSEWEPYDWVRLAIPPLALLAWLALQGTSALTPLLTGLKASWLVTSHAMPFLAGVVGVLLIFLNTRVNPPKPAQPPE